MHITNKYEYFNNHKIKIINYANLQKVYKSYFLLLTHICALYFIYNMFLINIKTLNVRRD